MKLMENKVHEVSIFPKFHKDWAKIVDILLGHSDFKIAFLVKLRLYVEPGFAPQNPFKATSNHFGRGVSTKIDWLSLRCCCFHSMAQLLLSLPGDQRMEYTAYHNDNPRGETGG